MTRARTGTRENRASRWLRRAGGAVALLALACIAAEFTVRVEDWVRWRMPITSSITGFGDMALLDATGKHPAPNTTFRQWRINSYGLRGDEPRTGATTRAIFLGASETFGQYEHADHDYVHQVGDSLLAQRCDADLQNAAFPGMSLPTVAQDVRLRLSHLKPRVMVYYPTPPQYLDLDLPRAVHPDSTGAPRSPLRWRWRMVPRVTDQIKLMLPSRVQDMLRERYIANERSKYPSNWLFRSLPDDRLAAFDHDLRQLVGTVRATGSDIILITHTNAFIGDPRADGDRLRAWERFYPRATGDVLVQFDSAAALVTRRIGVDSGVTVVDAWKAFHHYDANVLFADFAHFTDAGSARMASLLGPALHRALCGQ